MLVAACVFAAAATLLGAFGAHTLKQYATPEQLAVYEKGITYQFYYAFALFAAGLIRRIYQNKMVQWSATCFVVGMALFCGSLYTLVGAEILKLDGLSTWVGPLTPLGGLFFIAGWIFLAMGINRNGVVKPERT